jgi:hypothetical protein
MIDFDPDELGPGLDAAERTALGETAAGLAVARPLPAPGFRGDLRRRMLASVGHRLVARPPHLRRRVVALVCAGAVLLLVAASGLAGRGPLAAPAAAAAPGGHGAAAAARQPAPTESSRRQVTQSGNTKG